MDNTEDLWHKLDQERGCSLLNRYHGYYRAIVVETNDPLGMHRIRFKCPDLHDWNLADADCPWAVPAPDFGSKAAGQWSHPCKGDYVWITFERGHPYGPIVVGMAMPTRTHSYPIQSIYQSTPDARADYDTDFLPKDGRPMSHGWTDRYGNADISNAVGFHPKEHGAAPPPPDFDALTTSAFTQAQATPVTNGPDVKYLARITKYGHIQIMADQGYWWQSGDGFGEFSGDAEADANFEIARWKYLQKLLNEGQATGRDQRRQALQTRYGHLIEARDVGWAQPGPVSSMSRPGEYGPPTFLSRETQRDERWLKLRTGGGMLYQAYDKGLDPQDDDYIKRLLIDDIDSEEESKWWRDRDARQIRTVTRHGFKIVLDDRGSDPRHAQAQESPHGNGILIKGRRTGGSRNNKTRTGQPVGFYWEFNENDDANHTTWGTPLGQVIELNDATEYVVVAAGLGKSYAMPWRGLQENEFLRRPVRSMFPETTCHHLMLDQQNEFISLKTRSGSGPGPDDTSINPTGIDAGDVHQGLEARDGQKGDGPWLEIVDSEHRGLWLSRQRRFGIWRAAAATNSFILQDDGGKRIVLFNGEQTGRVQIYCAGAVEIVSGGDISMRCGGILNIAANGGIRLSGGGTRLTIGQGGLKYDGNIDNSGADDPALVDVPTQPDLREPTDRGMVYNQASVVSDDEIEHRL